MTTTYLDATHACPQWTVIQHHGAKAEFTDERMTPCIFAGSELRNNGLTIYKYVDCVFGERFYTYEPLPVWGWS